MLKIKAESEGKSCVSRPLKIGVVLRDFVETMQSNEKLQSEMTKLREMVEDYAKQFPATGFGKEMMRYKE